ncbi:hypothetical protein EB093_04125 [bacterium]|nr:hypothetical protein [bacterium]
MKIWLMTIGEPVPVSDAVGHRLHRTGQFADALSKTGHHVTWWASAFDHRSKTHLVHEYTTISKSDNYDIVLLKGCGYRRNISIQRIWDELQLASEFKRSSPNMIKPDIIVCSVPSIALAIAAVEYGKKNRIPVVLDGRDMWPDIFVEVLPTSLRWLGKIAVTPIESRCRWAFKHATAILGITDEFVNWGLKKSGRVRTSFDTAIPFAYSLTQQSQSKIAVAEQYWDSMGVRDNDDVFNVLFIGMIANTLDVDAILDASQDPRIKALNIRFIIAGDGDKLHHYKKLSSTYTNVVWPGWIDAAQIQVVMQRSHVGIDPMLCAAVCQSFQAPIMACSRTCCERQGVG